MVEFVLEGNYPSRAELVAAAQTCAKEIGFSVSIKSSNQSMVVLKCACGGEYRNRNRSTPELKKRKVKSRLTNCPFEVRGVLQRRLGGVWKVTKLEPTHNHGMSTDVEALDTVHEHFHPVHEGFVTLENLHTHMANWAIVQKYHGPGKPTWEKVELVQKEKPEGAKPGHVLIKLYLRPIKKSDLLFLRSDYFISKNPQAIVGNEGVGIVYAVGDGVEKFQIGQRVVPFFYRRFLLTGVGTWQRYIEVPESETFPIPDNVMDEDACQLFGNPFTAFTFFDELQIPKGEYLLQTAANGAIGRLVIQLAKHYGIRTINLVRRDDMDEELRSLGADEVINYTCEDVVERVKEITGGKLAFAAVDAVCGKLTKLVTSSVRNNGQLYVYGSMSGFDVTFDVRDIGFGTLFGRNIRVSYFYLPDHLMSSDDYTRVGNEVVKLFQARVFTGLHPDDYYKFTLANFRQAIRIAEETNGVKKVLFMN